MTRIPEHRAERLGPKTTRPAVRGQALAAALERVGLVVAQAPEGYRSVNLKPAQLAAVEPPRRSWRRSR